MQFTWDIKKSITNLKKHKISFEEAQTVFEDVEAILILDPDHSENEERFILLGKSTKSNILIVCHCYLEKETVLRIISARHATKKEKQSYQRRKN